MKVAKTRWHVVGDLVISFTSDGKLRDDEWSQLVQEIKTKPVTRYLVTSVGSVEVNSIQRKLMIDVLNAKKIPVAVVTDDSIVRGLVTAAHWLGVNVKAFPWKDVENAIVHLGITPPRVERVLEVTLRMKNDALL